MALIDFWKNNRDELRQKHVHQIIALAGDGKLLDGNPTSLEFRNFLALIPSSQLAKYALECLDDKFEGSGFALQDIVNQVGSRISFHVENGRYRGKPGEYGHDGLWTLKDLHKIIVEVKTTDAYSINLDTVAAYRKRLIQAKAANQENTSLLLVVGRHDTGGLEAQIRGSRYAWDMRIISVEGLLHLMKLKETVDDPAIVHKISNILVPQEFTKLDQIIDIVFATAEEVATVTEEEENDADEKSKREETSGPKFPPVKFHDACAERLEPYFGVSLIKESRSIYVSSDKSIRVWISVSKQHGDAKKEIYWFAFHPHQKEALKNSVNPSIALGCGSPNKIFIIPFNMLEKYLDDMWVTQREERMYWHIKIEGRKNKYCLLLKKGTNNPEITKYILGAG